MPKHELMGGENFEDIHVEVAPKSLLIDIQQKKSEFRNLLHKCVIFMK